MKRLTQPSDNMKKSMADRQGLAPKTKINKLDVMKEGL